MQVATSTFITGCALPGKLTPCKIRTARSNSLVVKSNLQDSQLPPHDQSNAAKLPTSKSEPRRLISVSKDKNDSQGQNHIGRRRLLGMGLGAMLACPCCSPLVPGKASASDWRYGGLEGPPQWSGICSSGREQSPIDIPLSSPAVIQDSIRQFGPLQFDYKNGPSEVVNTGHGTMQVNFPRGNYITVKCRTYELLQFHFHSPSEHTIDGVHTAMEVHLVHRNVDSGGLAVFGIMMEGRASQKYNRTLKQLLEISPTEPGEGIYVRGLKLDIFPTDFLPQPDAKDRNWGYVHYKGSLTTPPCSEGLDWFVFDKILNVSGQQVLDFQRFVGNGKNYSLNWRPVQPLGERVIEWGQKPNGVA
eukprot:jgi/Mesvir1/2327/Mv19353-RA.1